MATCSGSFKRMSGGLVIAALPIRSQVSPTPYAPDLGTALMYHRSASVCTGSRHSACHGAARHPWDAVKSGIPVCMLITRQAISSRVGLADIPSPVKTLMASTEINNVLATNNGQPGRFFVNAQYALPSDDEERQRQVRMSC